MKRSTLLAVIVLQTLGCAGDRPDSSDSRSQEVIPADVVVSWNDRILQVAEAEDGFLTLKGVRTATMAHMAMHDALAAIEPRFDAFHYDGDGAGADPITTASEAAYTVAISQYPDQQPLFKKERLRWKGQEVGDGEASHELGARVASSLLEFRADDGWNSDPSYQWHPMGPGVYAEFDEHSGTPEGFVFGAGWARATPFLMDSPRQLRSPPPPAIESEAYRVAFDEVKEVGSQNSSVRTLDQAHLAMWWKEFVEKSHNRLARRLVSEQGTDLWDAARLFALLNASVFDGYVASFDAKFFYNHWRPYTAIRWASNDGNPETVEDSTWTNLHNHTYAFPSYPSAHGTVCAAAMTALEDTFGDDFAFEMTTREVESAGPTSPKIPMDPPTRSFQSFSDAAEECSLSRVYLGIHFRYDSDAGTALGRQVGELAVRDFLAPTEGG